jgi:geranylgeranyl diphosphate synthase type II
MRSVLDSVPAGEPSRHLYALLPPYLLRPGKALRPVLCLATCSALGGSVDEALPVAAALELLHNAFLVHDDIQDDSPARRGGPSLHVEQGVPLALNAGDALVAIALAQLSSGLQGLGRRRAAAVVAEFDRLARQTIEGQAMELGWQRDNPADLTVADYLRMAVKKTAWYTAIEPVRIGALIASGGVVEPDFGIRFGFYVGAMFQLANDLTDLLRHARSDGPAGGTDIHEGKRTLMMLHLLEHAEGTDRQRVLRFLAMAQGERSGEEARWILDRMREAGSVDHALACLRGLAIAGLHETHRTFGQLPDSDDRELLVGIVPYVLEALGGSVTG